MPCLNQRRLYDDDHHHHEYFRIHLPKKTNSANRFSVGTITTLKAKLSEMAIVQQRKLMISLEQSLGTAFFVGKKQHPVAVVVLGI